MSERSKDKNQKSTRLRIAEVARQRGNSAHRVYSKKHSVAISFLYSSEQSEIDAMVKVADNLVKKQK